MTYAEAVNALSALAYNHEMVDPNDPAIPEADEALAVLRRAEKVMEAVENWDGRVEWQSAKPLVLAADTYRAALRYRDEKEKG